jgi:hypothetical protein
MMIGPLTGCVQEANEFALEGKFLYWRKDAFDGIPEHAFSYLEVAESHIPGRAKYQTILQPKKVPDDSIAWILGRIMVRPTTE